MKIEQGLRRSLCHARSGRGNGARRRAGGNAGRRDLPDRDAVGDLSASAQPVCRPLRGRGQYIAGRVSLPRRPAGGRRDRHRPVHRRRCGPDAAAGHARPRRAAAGGHQDRGSRAAAQWRPAQRVSRSRSSMRSCWVRTSNCISRSGNTVLRAWTEFDRAQRFAPQSPGGLSTSRPRVPHGSPSRQGGCRRQTGPTGSACNGVACARTCAIALFVGVVILHRRRSIIFAPIIIMFARTLLPHGELNTQAFSTPSRGRGLARPSSTA